MSDAILDKNLRALLTRAYVPELPAPEFRARLGRRFADEVESAARERRAPRIEARPARIARIARPARIARIGRPLGYALATAASLVALLFAARWSTGDDGARGESLDAILARGLPALRRAPDGAWTALTPADARGVDFAGPFLELAAPNGVQATALTASGGRASLTGPARVALRSGDVAGAVSGDGGARLALDVDLAPRVPGAPRAFGALALELGPGADGAWRATTTEGALLVRSGSARIDVVRWSDASSELAPGAPSPFGPDPAEPDLAGPGDPALVRVRVLAGDATVEGEPRLALSAGDVALLYSGRAWTPERGAPELDGETALGGQRVAVGVQRSLEAPSPDAQPDVDTGDAARAGVRGRVTSAGAPVDGGFLLSLLREANLPDVPQPLIDWHEDPDGRFEVLDIEPGTYSVFVHTPHHTVWKRDGLRVPAGGPPVELHVELSAAERGTKVRGWVTDAATGNPVRGALVVAEADFPSRVLPLDPEGPFAGILKKEFAMVAYTAADGSFELRRLSAGEHVLRASAPGYAPDWTSRFELEEGRGASGIALELGAPAAVEGSVRWSDGTPISGVMITSAYADYEGRHVCMTAGWTQTDEGGRYRIENLPPGFSTVVRIFLGEDPAAQAPRSRVSLTVLTAGETRTVDFVEQRRSATLRGRVLAPGRELDGYGLMISSLGRIDGALDEQSWEATAIGADGVYEFADLAPDDYGVFLSFGMNSSFSRIGQVTAVEGEVVVRDFQVGGASIRGAVRAGDTLDPLPDSILFLSAAGAGSRDQEFWGKQVAGEGGRFSFEFLAEGEYEVVALCPSAGYGNAELGRLVLSAAEPEVSVELLLPRGGSLDLEVVDEAGRPIPDAPVVLADAAGKTFEFAAAQQTDAAGRLSLEGLSAGTWTASARAAGHRTRSASLRIEAGRRTALRIALERGD